jgi:Uma2 family endonuclease
MSASQLAEVLETYPDSDGKPMADNTTQFRWITTIVGELEDMFRDDPNVFVAGDLLWYPVESETKINRAPDAMVVFGRPKEDRGSYKQWEEEDIAPQCVFDVCLSSNIQGEMQKKFAFYNRYGVEEYYIYDPDTGLLTGWLNGGSGLLPILHMQGWKSPRLGIRFELDGNHLSIYRPDGRRFASYIEQAQRADGAEQRAEVAEQRANAAEQRANAEAEARHHAEVEIARLKALLAEK